MSPSRLAVPAKRKERRLAAKQLAAATESKADHRNAKAEVLEPRKRSDFIAPAAAELESKDYAKGDTTACAKLRHCCVHATDGKAAARRNVQHCCLHATAAQQCAQKTAQQCAQKAAQLRAPAACTQIDHRTWPQKDQCFFRPQVRNYKE